MVVSGFRWYVCEKKLEVSPYLPLIRLVSFDLPFHTLPLLCQSSVDALALSWIERYVPPRFAEMNEESSLSVSDRVMDVSEVCTIYTVRDKALHLDFPSLSGYIEQPRKALNALI